MCIPRTSSRYAVVLPGLAVADDVAPNNTRILTLPHTSSAGQSRRKLPETSKQCNIKMTATERSIDEQISGIQPVFSSNFVKKKTKVKNKKEIKLQKKENIIVPNKHEK